MSERSSHQIFISHTTADDTFVSQLREMLAHYGISVWVDSRDLPDGTKLAEIERAIENAAQFIVVLSRSTLESSWVRREIRKALEVERQRKDEGYTVIPLLLPDFPLEVLRDWFEEEPRATRVQVGPDGLWAALPGILAALGRRLPPEPQPPEQPAAKPLEKLVLTLADPKVRMRDGKRRVTATATLMYEPGNHPAARRVMSRKFIFTAPFGPLEAEELRSYLESHFLWPVGVFATRAEALEKKLPQWGQDLFRAALGAEAAREALAAWQAAGPGAECRFSVQVDDNLPEGAAAEAQGAAREAAAGLFALPWELLHDGRGWLFQGQYPARVRRGLPNRHAQLARPTALPIRVLLICSRPERDGEGHAIDYIDHRLGARALVEVVEKLGELVRLTVLTPPTYEELARALHAAAERNEPFDVIHFDGHGFYDRRQQTGGLCFEDPKDSHRPKTRTMEFVDGSRLAGLFCQSRVPLVFLDACQTAVAEVDPTHSVAAQLLQEGVTSVVAMSHSVLIETSRRFAQAFYQSLANGSRIGTAMLAGQYALFSNTWRGTVPGAGDLHLQDWFVPVLYQEEQDPQLVTKIPPSEVRQLQERKRVASLGMLPKELPHKFQGCSRDLLALERLLHSKPWVVIRGMGGAGKTALAAELARWLTRTGRFARAAFVKLEECTDVPLLVRSLRQQLLPEGGEASLSSPEDQERALQEVERALWDHATILVLDSYDSLPRTPDETTPRISTSGILSLCRSLLEAGGRTRLVFTTRETLPAPFDGGGQQYELDALDEQDARELALTVMENNGWKPSAVDAGMDPREVVDLVQAVNYHAHALVLLAREAAVHRVAVTPANLPDLMADLEDRHRGDHENSLYASVERSLRRLRPETRELLPALAFCQGGVYLPALGMLTRLKDQNVLKFAHQLTEAGLGRITPYGHVRLHPGLAPYLLATTKAEERDDRHWRWAAAMAWLTAGLVYNRFANAEVVAGLTRLELPNLLAVLDWLQDRDTAEHVVSFARDVEMLLADLGDQQARARATDVREQAARELTGWGHVHVLNEVARIDRLLEGGPLSAAADAARQLLQRCCAAGESAYAEAAEDRATAEFELGRVLAQINDSEHALPQLDEAQRRFQRLADQEGAYVAAAEDRATTEFELDRVLAPLSNSEHVSLHLNEAQRRWQQRADQRHRPPEQTVRAAHAITKILYYKGNCLTKLGRLAEAAEAYKESSRRAGSLKGPKQVAENDCQLAEVRWQQENHPEAGKVLGEAARIFRELDDFRNEATVWRQAGRLYEGIGQPAEAEQYYRRSLAIDSQEKNRDGQASDLGHLSRLCLRTGHTEDASVFAQQAAKVRVERHDLCGEGKDRTYLALALSQLGRHEDARRELRRALECKEPFGHDGEIWTTWSVLETLERATRNTEAAQAARQKAIQTYLAYRRDGGVSLSACVDLFKQVGQAVQQKNPDETRGLLSQSASQPGTTRYVQGVIAKLLSVLEGNPDGVRADDSELGFVDAAELWLLLESLASY